MRSIRFQFLLLLGSVFLVLPSASAQITAGIRGTVADPSGAVIPQSKLTVTNVDTGFSRTTAAGASGVYTFTLLPVGTYKLNVQAPGFKVYEQSGIILSTNEVLGLNVTLQVGDVKQKVEISGAAPVVNTQTSEISTLVNAQQIEELPLNGRNPIQLATLTNGVNDSTIQTVIEGNDARAANHLGINGNQDFMTEYQLDGVTYEEPNWNSAYNYPNPDAIEEFRFITNSYSAEFGRDPGGVMEVLTKSGSNGLHGDAWEFNRNSDYAARPFFQNTVPFLNQNQYGFDVGGPIRKDKLFAFGSAQWFKIRGGTAVSSAFPATAAERNGDFSADKLQPIDPSTGLAFPGGIIPAADFDPVAVKYLNIIPLPNSPSGAWIGSLSAPTDNYQFIIKPDWLASSRQRLSGSFFIDRTKSTSPLDFGRFNIPFVNTTGNPDEFNNVRTTSAIVNYIYNLTPTVLNNFRAGLFQLFQDTAAPGRGPTMQQLGAIFPKIGPLQDIPNISPTGRWFDGTGNFGVINDYSFQFSDDISYIRHSHSVKFGVDYRRQENRDTGTSNDPGIFLPSNGAPAFNSLANMMLGRALLYVSNDGIDALHNHSFQTYMQDDYKVSRNLVVNLGLRYEFTPMWQTEPTRKTPTGGGILEGVCFAAGAIPGPQSIVFKDAPPGLLYPYEPGFGVADPGCPPNLTYSHKHDFAPRLGVAWDVRGNGKTSLRAAWGLFYHTPHMDYIGNTLSGPPGFVNVEVPITPNFTNPVASLSGTFPLQYTQNLNFSTLGTQSIDFLDPHIGEAVIQQFNFTLQHELRSRTSVQVAYVGNVSDHLLAEQELNPPIYIPGVGANGQPLSAVANEPSRRPYNQPFLTENPLPYGQLGWASSDSNSAYHGLQTEVRIRALRGLDLLGSYTWSKVIDFDTYFLVGGILGGYGQNPYDRDAERGLANFDHANIFRGSIIYSTPSVTKFLRVNNLIARGVADHWEMTSIITLMSGAPFTVATGADNSLVGEEQDRPNLVGDPRLPSGRSRGALIQAYFNTKAFVINPPGTFGDLGRNTGIGPGLANVDFGMFKNFPIHDRMRLQFRVEFFNFFNQPDFSNPDGGLGDVAFGKITSTSKPGRIIQLGGKFTF